MPNFGPLFFVVTISALMGTVTCENRVVPSMGKKASLGQVYDAVHEKFKNGSILIPLFSPSVISMTSPPPSRMTSVKKMDSNLSEKFTKLQIDHNLRASILANQVSINLIENLTSNWEIASLVLTNQSVTWSIDWQNEGIKSQEFLNPGSYDGTHFVEKIEWGLQITFILVSPKKVFPGQGQIDHDLDQLASLLYKVENNQNDCQGGESEFKDILLIDIFESGASHVFVHCHWSILVEEDLSIEYKMRFESTSGVINFYKKHLSQLRHSRGVPLFYHLTSLDKLREYSKLTPSNFQYRPYISHFPSNQSILTKLTQVHEKLVTSREEIYVHISTLSDLCFPAREKNDLNLYFEGKKREVENLIENFTTTFRSHLENYRSGQGSSGLTTFWSNVKSSNNTNNTMVLKKVNEKLNFVTQSLVLGSTIIMGSASTVSDLWHNFPKNGQIQLVHLSSKSIIANPKSLKKIRDSIFQVNSAATRLFIVDCDCPSVGSSFPDCPSLTSPLLFNVDPSSYGQPSSLLSVTTFNQFRLNRASFSSDEDPTWVTLGQPEELLSVAALGRTARIGLLYDAYTDRFTSVNILDQLYLPENEELLRKFVQNTDSSHTKSQSEIIQGSWDRSKFFDVSLSLKLSAFAGLLKGHLNGKYLTQEESQGDEVTGIFFYDLRTMDEMLLFNNPDLLRWISRSGVSQGSETHVVTGIRWGARVLATFGDKMNKSKSVDQKYFELSGAFKKIAGFNIGGNFTYNQTKELTEAFSHFSFELMGDVNIGDSPFPDDPISALTLLKNIPLKISQSNGGKASQISFSLYPLNKLKDRLDSTLQNKKNNLYVEIDEVITQQLLKTFVNIHGVNKQIEGLVGLVTGFSHLLTPAQIEDIKMIKEEFDKIVLTFTSHIQNDIKAVRGGDKNVEILKLEQELLLSDEWSPQETLKKIEKFHFVREKVYVYNAYVDKNIIYLGHGSHPSNLGNKVPSFVYYRAGYLKLNPEEFYKDFFAHLAFPAKNPDKQLIVVDCDLHGDRNHTCKPSPNFGSLPNIQPTPSCRKFVSDTFDNVAYTICQSPKVTIMVICENPREKARLWNILQLNGTVILFKWNLSKIPADPFPHPYDNAAAACKSLGLHLANIKRADHLLFNAKFALRSGSRRDVFWVGSKRESGTMEFRWAFDGTIVDPILWSEGRPSRSKSLKSCLTFEVVGRGLKDESCDPANWNQVLCQG